MKLTKIQLENIEELSAQVYTAIDYEYNKYFDESDEFDRDDDSFTADMYEVGDQDTSDYHWEIMAGASKICFVCEELPFVVKFPVPTQYVFNSGTGENKDYCEKEYEVYQIAKNSPYKKMFAQIKKIETKSGAVYIQPKIEDNGFYAPKTAVSRDNQLYDLSSPLRHIDKIKYLAGASYTFWEYMSVRYGFVFACNFSRFCRRANVNDLHGGNYKFDDNNLCIFDYSGFFFG